MTPTPPRPNDLTALRELFAALCDETISTDQLQQVEKTLCQDVQARAYFARLMQLHVLLEHKFADASPREEHPYPSIIDNDTAAPVATLSAPFLPLLSPTIPSTMGFFSAGWPVAYLLATVILGMGLFIGSLMPASKPEQIAGQSSAPNRTVAGWKSESVGRITGMVDCKWVQGPALGPRLSSLVSLGDKYALASGLMEITYDSGAKVIVQGPVAYEVESRNSGFLSIGKLTARLEKKAEGGRRKAEEATNLSSPGTDRRLVGGGAGGEGGEKDSDHDQTQPALTLALSQRERGPDITPESVILNSSLFSVRTPTAVVTDLGTEFGVEVDATGATQSHVFRGSIRVQAVAPGGGADGAGKVLHKDESARVENRGTQGGRNRITMLVDSANSADFVRTIPKRSIKSLDLVDVVAGGDGFSGKRGIDPTNGRTVDALWSPSKPRTYMLSDGQYHRVTGMPFVDGVFIPDGRRKSTPVTSAGHGFDGFRGGANVAGQFIWAGGAMPPYPTMLCGVDYASPGHGALLLHANNAITFDLEAIRRANPGCRLLRFDTVVANLAPDGETAHARSSGQGGDAEVWVLVDGQERFKRQHILNWSDAIPIVFRLGRQDRFLTLATTDGGKGISFDWLMFGDPKLDLLSIENKEN